MYIHTDDITAYIPQRTPIVMIGGILEVKDKITRTGLQIAADNVFVEDGVLKSPGLLENIGFIGAVKNFEVFAFPPAGTFIETTTEIQSQVMNATLVNAKVTLDGQVMAQCELSIFINP
jgi:hypothetical protein